MTRIRNHPSTGENWKELESVIRLIKYLIIQYSSAWLSLLVLADCIYRTGTVDISKESTYDMEREPPKRK